MTTATIKQAARSFFTIRPTRQANVARSVSIAGVIGIVVSQLLDFATTILGLAAGANEANGAMAQLITQYGPGGFLLVKALAGTFLIWATWRRPLAQWVVSLIYFGVALWNIVMTMIALGMFA